MKISRSGEETIFSNDRLTNIGLILLAFFAGLSRDREPNIKRERAMLQSVAQEFRRGEEKKEEKMSIFSRAQKDNRIELSAKLTPFFSDTGAITANGAEELQHVAESLAGGTAALKIILILEGMEEDQILRAEDRLRRLKDFIIAEGAPKFAVTSEIAFGASEQLLLGISGGGDRIRWQ